MKINQLANQFKAFSEPVRLRILYLLLEKQEVCVCGLVESLNLTQSVVSRHLAYLRNNNLIEARKKGTWVHYKIKATQIELIDKTLSLYLEYARNAYELQEDLSRMNNLNTNC